MQGKETRSKRKTPCHEGDVTRFDSAHFFTATLALSCGIGIVSGLSRCDSVKYLPCGDLGGGFIHLALKSPRRQEHTFWRGRRKEEEVGRRRGGKGGGDMMEKVFATFRLGRRCGFTFRLGGEPSIFKKSCFRQILRIH